MQYLDAILKTTEWFVFVSKENFQYHSNPSLYPNQHAKIAEVEWFYKDIQNILEQHPPPRKKKKNALFIIGNWNAKVASQETPWVAGKFGLGVQNEAGQMQTLLCQENALVIANTHFQQHKRRHYT